MRILFTTLVLMTLGCTVGIKLDRSEKTDDDAAGDESANNGETGGNGASDTTPPTAPGAATGFALASDTTKAVLRWASAGKDDDGSMAKQQLLLFGGDKECSGSADATIDLSATATSYTWSHFSNPGVGGVVRFQVKAINAAGLSATSSCSNSFNLRTGQIEIHGASNSGNLGRGLYSDIGDVNGDSYKDWVSYSGNSIVVFLGGPTKYYQGSYVLAGDATFTASTPRLADLTGDGKDEIYFYDSAYGAGMGAIHVIQWTDSIQKSDTIANVAIRRYDADYSGDDITFVGASDLTGDGAAEIILGGENADSNTFTNNGMLVVIPGGTLPASAAFLTAGYRYHGDEDSAFLGENMTVSADYNGDGLNDVTSYGENVREGGNNRGGVYLFLSNTTALPASGAIDTQGHKYSGPADEIDFMDDFWNGHWQNAVPHGDFNGDGIADLVLWDTYFNGNRGRVHLILGGASMPASNDATTVADGIYTGTTGDDSFGRNLFLEDVTGDGRDDIISQDPDNAGVVYFLAGAAAAPASNDVVTAGGSRVVGSGGTDAIGGANRTLAIKDITGDGIKDFMILASLSYLWVYKGGATLPTTGDTDASGSKYSGFFGGKFAFADLTGDGANEAIITGFPNTLQVISSSGGNLPAAALAYSGTGIHTSIMSVYQDLTGDGIADFLNGETSDGTAFFIKGGTLPASGAITPISLAGGSDAVKITGPIADFNGDGANDVVYEITGVGLSVVYGGVNSDAFEIMPLSRDGYGDTVNDYTSSLWMNVLQDYHEYPILDGTAYDYTGDGVVDLMLGNYLADTNALTNNGMVQFIPSDLFPKP